jgi:hypothetical protein
MENIHIWNICNESTYLKFNNVAAYSSKEFLYAMVSLFDLSSIKFFLNVET